MKSNSNSIDLFDVEISLAMTLQEMGINPNPSLQIMRELPPALVQAYFEARYCFNADSKEIVLTIGNHSDELQEFLESNEYKTWAFISAYNPYSEELSDQENAKRQYLLKQTLEDLSYSFIEGKGGSDDKSWSEPSLFIPDVSIELAESLGVRFQQNAILYGERGFAPLILFCGRA
tara:strand:+ start:873 stop:1400 length:528 start_codon:yes stop_codon:yes gene_type:complete